MRFLTRQRRQAPPIIIISLIDILIVLLIFVMATTTFKQRPAVKISLPESKHAQMGSGEKGLTVTLSKEGHLFLGETLVTLEKLRQELRAAIIKKPDLSLTVRGDTNAPLGPFFEIMEISRDLRIKHLNMSSNLKRAGQ